MKRLTFAAATVAALCAAPAFAATIYVPKNGDTGWQSYSYTFSAAFAGSVTLGVSDEDDTKISSALLVDKIGGSAFVSPSLTTNQGFELNNFSGYVVAPGSNATTVSSFDSYTPTEGSLMALLESNGTVVTSVYLNTLSEAGTQGSLGSFAIFANAGDTLTFDWAFIAADYHPYNDFAFITLNGAGPANGHYGVMAEISAIPVPAAAWLMGSGLLGLAGISRRNQQQA